MTWMRWGMLLLVVVTAGCGRLGLDPVSATGDGASGDGLGSDGMLGDGPPAVSCGTLASTCGPSGTSPCCESPVVPGGMYFRSYDGVDYIDSGYPATCASEQLDRVRRHSRPLPVGSATQEHR